MILRDAWQLARTLLQTMLALTAALLLTGILMYVFSDDVPASEATGELAPEAQRMIRKALRATRIERVAATPFPGIYEITAGTNVIYTEQTGRYLFIGHIYDLHTATDLTAARQAEVSAKNDRIPWESLPLSAAVVHGSGRQRLAVISDPGCGWCRKLHAESFPALEGVEITEILYPVMPGSLQAATRILCADDPAKALAAHFAGEPSIAEPDEACAVAAGKRLASALRFGRDQGVQGTPLLIAPDGTTHPGYLAGKALAEWIAKHQGDPS